MVCSFELPLSQSYGFELLTMASSLRRRIVDGEKPSELREGTPEKAEEVRLAPVSKIHNTKHHKPKGHKRRHLFLFFLGGLAGIFAAGFFARSNDLIEFPEFGTMDSLLDVLPANFVKDARDLMVCFPFPFRDRILATQLTIFAERRARDC